MAKAGTVSIDFAAETAKFTGELKKVRSQLAGLQAETAKVSGALGGASKTFVALGAAVAAVGFTGLIGNALRAADALEKTSARTGIAVEAIQRLQFVGDAASVGLDAITSGINKMQVGLAEGGGRSVAALSALGLKFSEFRNLAPEKQFELVAQGVARIDDPVKRASIAVGVFGKSGTELLPILRDMGTGFREAEARLDAIGGPVGSAAIEAVDTLGDRLGDLKTAASNLGIELLGTLAPVLTTITEKAGNLIAGLRVLDGIGADPLVNLDTQIRDVTNQIDRILISSRNNPQAGDLLRIQELRKELLGLEAQYNRLAGLGKEGAAAALERRAELMASLQPVAITVKRMPTPFDDTPQGRRESTLRANADPLQIAALEADQLQQLNKKKLDTILQQETAAASSILDVHRTLTDDLRTLGVNVISFEEFKNASIKESALGLAGFALDTANSLFDNNKVIGIATALVSTYTGAANALRDVPYPFNIAAAALVVAQGLKTVQKIKSVNKHGGGGGGAGFGGGDVAFRGGATLGTLSNLAPVTPADGDARPQKVINITVNGLITEAGVREIFDLAGDMVENGYVFINGRSNQGQIIRDSLK